ncbi:MAG: cistern family PEP-CTERM protein [Leptolyngbyaceae cyanobacterium SL_7_1]|nr:cistern family PEP-CTERM protein [Leptolyngbyaceae cyanobacterium SL_7_1]
MKKHLLTSAIATSTLAAASVFQAAPASALSFDGRLAIFGSGDVNQSFTVDFVDNFINSTPDNRLRSKATVTINGFSATGGQTNVTLGINLANQSSIDSILSAFGFNVGSITNGILNDNVQVREDKNNGTRITSNTVGGSTFDVTEFGNQAGFANLGKREVSFEAKQTPNGIHDGTNDSFTAILSLGSEVGEVTLYNFAARYQEINASNLPTGSSGAGRAIPTPALLPGLVGLAFGALRKKQHTEAEQNV